MGENSKIEWCDHTWNPWIGCTKVGEGCKHCYAEELNKRYQWTEWGDEGQRHLTSPDYWRKPITWNQKQRKLEERDPSAVLLRPKVFCASLADVFDNHPSIKLEWQSDLMQLWFDTPYLTWLVLTKRPENIPDNLILPKNVWIGISASTNDELDLLMGRIRTKPINKLFVSFEPLLGHIKLRPWQTMIDWVIVGGESGLHARHMQAEWPGHLITQCIEDGIPYFFKQHGEWIAKHMIAPGLLDTIDNVPAVKTGDVTYYRLGKSKCNEVAMTNYGYYQREFPTLVESEHERA